MKEMTREEAIKELKDLKDYCKDTFMKRTLLPYLEALDMAIKALEQDTIIRQDKSQDKALHVRR